MAKDTYIGNQIKLYFDKKGYSQQDIADELGVSQAAVSVYLSGLRPFGKNVAQKWHDTFGFRKSWLATGEGPMFDDEEKNAICQTISDNTGIAIQQIGERSSATTTSSHDESFFTRLCSDLMQQIMERDRKICCLEERIRELENND